MAARRSFHPLQQMVPDPHGVGDDGQRWIHRGARHEKARVHDVEVVQIMRLAIHIEGRRLRCELQGDRKSTRLNSSHLVISYAVFCLKKKKKDENVAY